LLKTFGMERGNKQGEEVKGGREKKREKDDLALVSLSFST